MPRHSPASSTRSSRLSTEAPIIPEAGPSARARSQDISPTKDVLTSSEEEEEEEIEYRPPAKRKSPPSPPKIRLRLGGDTSPAKSDVGSRTRSRSPIKDVTPILDPPVIPSKRPSPVKESVAARRAPRKKRKWLKKGEVDPDDPVAVARQKERFQIIDEAIKDLERQEKLVKHGTHRQLELLLDELDRRRDIQLQRIDDREVAAVEELEYITECDDHFTRETWRVSLVPYKLTNSIKRLPSTTT